MFPTTVHPGKRLVKYFKGVAQPSCAILQVRGWGDYKELLRPGPFIFLLFLQNDLGFLTFDLQADLAPLFNWNVKQLFLYLTAEYETQANAVNQVVLWDKIIQRGENAVLDYRLGKNRITVVQILTLLAHYCVICFIFIYISFLHFLDQ